MESFGEEIEQIQGKLKLLENFIVLSLRREEVGPQLQNLQEKVNGVWKLVEEVNELTSNKLKQMNKEYDILMVRMKKSQLAILEYVIDERRRKMQEAERDDKQIKTIINKSVKKNKSVDLLVAVASSSKSLVPNMAQLRLNQNETPKMTIYDYKESPLVKRTKLNPVPISFLEFEYHITPATFETIPKYMRGRAQLDELNHFLEHTIIACFNNKYQLMHRKREVVRNPTDKELWIMYNEQASYFPGRHFITIGDIARKLDRVVDKKMQNRLTMLRHITVLQEQRVKQTVCYIWTVNSIF